MNVKLAYGIRNGRVVHIELKLPAERPLTMSKLTKEQFDAEILKGMNDIDNGQVLSTDEVEAEMRRMYNL